MKDSYSQDVWGHKAAGGVPTTPPTVPDDGGMRGGWARPPPSSATPASSQAGTPRAAAAAASAAAPSAQQQQPPHALFPSEAAAAAADAAADSPLPSSPRHQEESGAIFDSASLDHEGLRHLPPPPPPQSLSRAKEAAMFFQHAPSEVPLPRAGTTGVDSSAISPKRRAKGTSASSPWTGAALVPAAAAAAPPSVAASAAAAAAFSDTRDVTPLRPQAPRGGGGGGAGKPPWPSQADSVPQLVRAYERERVASGQHTRDVEDNIHRSYMERLQDNARRHVRGMDKPHVSPHAPSTRTARTPLDVESASAMAAADGGGGGGASARDGKLSQLKRRYSDLQVGRERARERRVQFVDADGDAIAFSAEAGCLVVSVNGEELCRPRTVTADRTTASLDLDDGAATCPLPLSNNMALVERIAALVDTTPTCHNLHSWKAESWA